MKNENSITGKYLSGKLRIKVPRKRRTPEDFIIIKGASENNLKKINVHLPIGVLCGITGVSGSGKSTLMNQTLIPALKYEFGFRVDKMGKYETIEIPDTVRNVIVIDQESNWKNSKE